MILAVDQLLEVALSNRHGRDLYQVTSSRRVSEELARIADAESERAILLVGDSVLAGDVLARHPDLYSGDWRDQRILDFLRREIHSEDSVTLGQVASNALLPIDLERIVAELDRADPDHKVELLVEINLRFFSPSYAETSGCTLDVYCDLPGLIEVDSQDVRQGNRGFDFDALRSRMPVWRHREMLATTRLLPDPSEVAVRTKPLPTPDDLMAIARIESHYRVRLGTDSLQLEALERVIRHLAASGRSALFFATPLRDGFASRVHTQPALSNLYGQLAALIHSWGGEGVEFSVFDHPLFSDAHFVDHVHLLPEGNRLLAVNLAAELGLRLMRRPAPYTLVYDYGINRTLLSGGDVAHVNGPSFSAGYEEVDGLAFDPATRRLILADTGNHTVRVMSGNLRNLEVLAGVAGRPGATDGPRLAARFYRPHRPVVAEGRVLVLDAGGHRIREIDGDTVKTALRHIEPRLVDLAGRAGRVYALAADGSVGRVAEGRQVPVLAPPPEDIRLEHLAVSHEGDLFVADATRVWQGRIQADAPIPFSAMELLIASEGEGNLPERGGRFPMPFEEIAFNQISAIRYVDRYAGLLVVDNVNLNSWQMGSPASERAHLRLVHPASRRVFPWLKPYVNGNAYFPPHHKAKPPGSSYHVSNIALDPSTRDLYLLEKHRTRLIRIEDGLYGASRIADSVASQTTPFGSMSARQVRDQFEPVHDRPARARQNGMRGHLIGVYAGSSVIIAADSHGYYELVRAIERELNQDLALRERLLVDIFPLAQPASAIPGAIRRALDFMRLSFIPDFVLIDSNEIFVGMIKFIENGKSLTGLAALSRLASEYDFELIVVDNSGLGGSRRDGLLPRSEVYRDFIDDLRNAGIRTLEPTSSLLPSHLHVAPWGNLPYRPGHHHGSPQAIEETAKKLAQQLAPLLARRFREHPPAAERLRMPTDQVLGGGLVSTIPRARRGAIKRQPRIPAALAQVRLEDNELQILIDVGRLEKRNSKIAANEAGVLSAIRTFVLEDARGRMADALHVRFVRFANYDEYGRGTLQDAETLFEVKASAEEGLSKF